MSTFKVESGIEHYRIVGPNGEEGEPVPYEAIATLKIGTGASAQIYYCDATEDPDAEEHTVECVTESRQVETITDDVVFTDLGEVAEEEDEPGDEEDDEEEEEEVGPELVK